MKIYNPLRNKRGESVLGILGAIVGGVIGSYYPGIGTVAGAMWGYAIVSGVEMLITGIPSPDLPSLGDISATYNGPSPVDTIREGIPIPRAYGRCQVAGNKIRINDINTENTIKILLAHCMGRVSGVISYQVNDIDWASLDGSNSYNFYTGTTNQLYDNRFAGDTLGSELIANPNCDANFMDTVTAPWAYDAGGDEYDIDGSQGALVSMSENLSAVTTNNFYRFYATIGNYEAGYIRFRIGGGESSGWYSTDRVISLDLLSGATSDGNIYIDADADYNGSLQYFSVKNSTGRDCTYRGIAYSAFTFSKTSQIGWNPNITVVGDWTMCTPIGEVTSGASDKVFSRNPAVILYDWYINVEKYSYSEIDIAAFRELETFCDVLDTESGTSRYTFDYIFDTSISINDAKKLIWQSFNGACIQDQGKLKPVWESAKENISYAFNTRNIIRGSFTWTKPRVPNIFRIYYIDGNDTWNKTFIEVKNEESIRVRGEILHEENCWFINNPSTARKRARFVREKAEATDFTCRLKSFSSAGHLEIYDRVTVTHPLAGWVAKDFIVRGISEDSLGRLEFLLEAFYAGIYHGEPAVIQSSYFSTLGNQAEPSQIDRKEKIIVSNDSMDADYISVSAAIDAVSATRSLIYIKNGIYNLDRMINLPNKSLKIFGESREGTILLNEIDTTAFWAASIANGVKQHFSNFSVSSQNSSVASSIAMFYINNCSAHSQFILDGISFYLTDNHVDTLVPADPRYGDYSLFAERSGTILFLNSSVSRGAIAVQANRNKHIIIQNNDFFDQAWIGCHSYDNEKLNILNNNFADFVSAGVRDFWQDTNHPPTVPLINIGYNTFTCNKPEKSDGGSVFRAISIAATPIASVNINNNIINLGDVSNINIIAIQAQGLGGLNTGYKIDNNNIYIKTNDNIMVDEYVEGISLNQINDSNVTNNIITIDHASQGVTGIDLASKCTNTLVANNHINSTQGNGCGFMIRSNCWNNFGTNNITNNVATSISNAGINTTITATDY